MRRLMGESLVLVSTLDCNFQCNFCVRRQLNEKFNLPLVKMTPQTAEQILKQNPAIKSITVTGGEPFLNFELIDYLSNREDLTLTIITNGSILLPQNFHFKNKKMRIKISCNSSDNLPPLFYQLQNFSDVEIICNIFLDNVDNVKKIINEITRYRIKGYFVANDFWTEISEEQEKLVIHAGEVLSQFIPLKKDLGFITYFRQDQEKESLIYNPLGEKEKKLYSTFISDEEVSKQIIKRSPNFQNVFCRGKILFPFGQKFFRTPYEYYQALLFETMIKSTSFDLKKFL